VQDSRVVDAAVVSELRRDKYRAVRFKNFEYGSAEVRMIYYDEGGVQKEKSVQIYIREKKENTSNELFLYFVILVAVIEGAYLYKLRRKK